MYHESVAIFKSNHVRFETQWTKEKKNNNWKRINFVQPTGDINVTKQDYDAK